MADFLAFNTITTIIGLGIIIERRVETFTSAFTLGRAFFGFNIAFIAFFTSITIDFYYSFYTFFIITTYNLASFFTATLTFFIAVSFTFRSLSSLF